MSAIFLASCELAGRSANPHQLRHMRLKSFMNDIQIAVLEKDITNQVQLIQWTQLYIASTNTLTKQLLPYFNYIWLNTYYNEWCPSIPIYTNSSAPVALAAEYILNGVVYNVSIDFKTQCTNTVLKSDYGYVKYDITNIVQ